MELMIYHGESIPEGLNVVAGTAGGLKSTVAGCESATYRGSSAVVITSTLAKESWSRLVDIAKYYENLGYVVVLLASSSDLNQWLERLNDGLRHQGGLSLDNAQRDSLDEDYMWSC